MIRFIKMIAPDNWTFARHYVLVNLGARLMTWWGFHPVSALFFAMLMQFVVEGNQYRMYREKHSHKDWIKYRLKDTIWDTLAAFVGAAVFIFPATTPLFFSRWIPVK